MSVEVEGFRQDVSIIDVLFRTHIDFFVDHVGYEKLFPPGRFDSTLWVPEAVA